MGSEGAVLGMGKKGAQWREGFGGRIGKTQPLTDWQWGRGRREGNCAQNPKRTRIELIGDTWGTCWSGSCCFSSREQVCLGWEVHTQEQLLVQWELSACFLLGAQLMHSAHSLSPLLSQRWLWATLGSQADKLCHISFQDSFLWHSWWLEWGE